MSDDDNQPLQAIPVFNAPWAEVPLQPEGLLEGPVCQKCHYVSSLTGECDCD